MYSPNIANIRYKETSDNMDTTFHIEREFGTGTPRPGMDEEYAAQRLEDAQNAIADFNFAQAAKAAAAAVKRRISPRSRTFYRMAASHQVKAAFDTLEKENEKIPDESRRMPKSDVKLLKHVIQQFRVRLVVHDSQSLTQMKKETYAKAQQDETAAELAMQKAYASRDVQEYLNAKDRHQDMKVWRMDVSNEIARVEPKFNRTTGEMNVPGVASQHAQIPQSAGVLLRNILTPETIRRRFISLQMLTKHIRDEVANFLSDPQRHNDRAEVVKQIKEEKRVLRLQKQKKIAHNGGD